MFGPVLGGERVRLRPPDESDAPRFLAWFADLEVTRHLATTFPPGLEQEREWMKNTASARDVVFWMIEAGGAPIGSTGIHAIDWVNRRGVTGIVIGERSAWGKGYATEAMRLRTEFAFLQLGLHKLETQVFVGNDASRRALERNGYRGIGISREHMWRDGRWHDMWRGELLRADWEASRQPP